MYPEVCLAGNAGAGKSTLANLLKDAVGAPSIEYADEIKRFCHRVFGFTEEQLWGPSEARNASDPRFELHGYEWANAQIQMLRLGPTWVVEVFNCAAEEIYPSLFKDWFGPMEKAGTLSPRRALQALGEWGRIHQRNVWVNRAGEMSAQVLEGGCRYDRVEGLVTELGRPAPLFTCIVGARFPNEVLGTKARGGFAVLIEEPSAGLTGTAGQHVSETSLALIPRGWYSAIVQNDREAGLEHLQSEAVQLVEHVQSRL